VLSILFNKVDSLSDTFPASTPPKHIIIIRKIVFALAMAGLFIVLGIVTGFGYHVNSIRQLSFVTHSQYGYADATFYCDITFNPILYPTYWLGGRGHTVGNFTMLYIPESYRPGEFGGANWGAGPESHYSTYIMYVVTSEFNFNLIYCFLVPFLVEIAGSREVYIALLSGVVGFAVATVIGLFVGLLIGTVLALFVLFRLSRTGVLERFWRSLTEPEPV
jgi:hypothetical protein